MPLHGTYGTHLVFRFSDFAMDLPLNYLRKDTVIELFIVPYKVEPRRTAQKMKTEIGGYQIC